MIPWIADNWEYLMIGFYILEKIVHLSKAKWDDIVVDGIRAIVEKLKYIFKGY